MDVREAVGRAEQQDLGVRHGGVQCVHEGDRATGGHERRSRRPTRSRALRARRRTRARSSWPRTRCRSRPPGPRAAIPNGRSSRGGGSARPGLGGVLRGMDAEVELRSACGTTALSALSTEDVDPRDRDRRARPDPLAEAAGADERQPGSISASSRNSSSLYEAPVHSSRRSPDDDVAVLVVERGQRVEQRRSAHPVRRRRTGRCASGPASVVDLDRRTPCRAGRP